MIVYKRGLGYHHKRVCRQICDKNDHIYKMKSREGAGIFDSIIQPIVDMVSKNKDTLKHVGETVVNAVKVGKNTRQIVNSIKNKLRPRDLTVNENIAYEHKDLKNIIRRINELKFGEGFKYT